MPRRKKQDPIIQPTPLPIDEHWWGIYCHSILGLTKTIGHPQIIIDTETEEALKDPLFPIYLKYGPGKTGGPATISDFLMLPPDKRKFYLDIFKDWKQTVKREGIDKQLMMIENPPQKPPQPR